MTAHVRTGSVWKTLNTLHVRVGGAWKDVAAGWVRVGGVWRQFYSAVTVALDASYSATGEDFASPWSSAAGLLLYNTGDMDRYTVNDGVASYFALTDWLISGSASDYDVRVTKTGGSGTLVGLVSGTWYNLSSSRQFYVERTTFGITDFTGTLELRMAASPFTVLASATVSFTCSNTFP